ncbi:MAG: response regulator [Desulfobacterales bacterium]|nr:response regulator [Desulfobacterales bacterium]
MERTILLVDDEPDIREVLDIYLTDLGYTVHTAENGRKALDVFHRTVPSIVLSDIKMPGMDGIELLRRIKQESPETEVVMITGHGDMDLAIDSLKLQATDFITKPVNDNILEFALQRAEERIEMRRRLRAYTENLEQMVEEKTRQLLESEKMAAVGRVAAELSHTIKNIAGALKGGIYVLGRGIEDDNREYLQRGWEMVRGNVDKIKNLSLDLLNFGKGEELHLEAVDPLDPLQEVLVLLKAKAEEKGVALRTDLDTSIPPSRFDREAIYLCLLNLVQNALEAFDEEAARADGREVVIRAFRPPGWAVAYEISDNGPGMDADTRERLFKGFFSTKGTRGTGIGLTMTKRIVEHHQGTIAVVSSRGTGTRFMLCLPDSP